MCTDMALTHILAASWQPKTGQPGSASCNNFYYLQAHKPMAQTTLGKGPVEPFGSLGGVVETLVRPMYPDTGTPGATSQECHLPC